MSTVPSFALTSITSVDALAEAYPWPSGPWLRAMMLTTLDGAATGPDGLSGSISSPADQRVFAETRRLSDAVLVGAGTLVAEQYQPVKARPEHRDERAALGLAEAPRLVVVSASLELGWDEPVFTESTIRPLVVTTAGSDPLQRDAAAGSVVVELSSESMDPVELLDVLRSYGLERIVCEGGPHLLSTLAAADVVDEADISIAPLIVGGGQIPTDNPTAMRRFDLVGVIVDDGYLFNRYVHSRHRERVS